MAKGKGHPSFLRFLVSSLSEDSTPNTIAHARQLSVQQRPAIDDRNAWSSYWEQQNLPWRTEPEIDDKRQKYLVERLVLPSDTKQGIYPFKNIKLSRADVEWMLASHNEGFGSLFPGEIITGRGTGLDLRGADLRYTDLSRLPLVRMRGGLGSAEWFTATKKQREAAAIHLEGAKLRGADLRQASIRSAHLEGADLRYAYLEGTILRGTILAGNGATLPPADLRHASLDHDTDLEDAILGDKEHGFVCLADIHWGDVNLGVVKWSRVKMLGDEHKSRQSKTSQGEVKSSSKRLEEYQEALRANRQLAIALQKQGLNEDAGYFAYRAQQLQRIILRRQRQFGQYLFMLFLDLLAGYGYKPVRSLIAYLVIILGFMGLYLVNAHFGTPHLRWDEALVLSISSFHGRGFFSQDISLGDAYARLAGAEAMIGFIIEISFIATFTQRFLGK